MTNIFYSTSSRNSMTDDLKRRVTSELEKTENLKVYDTEDKPCSNDFGKHMLTQIENADLFVADITPDIKEIDLTCITSDVKENNLIDIISEVKKNSLISFNEHVMIELGYAMKCHSQEKMLFFKQRYLGKNDVKIPIFIEAARLFFYDTNDDDYVECITETIRDNITMNIEWTIIKYDFPRNIHRLINHHGITIKKLELKINRRDKCMFIFITQDDNNTHNYINVSKREIINEMTKIPIDLSTDQEFNNELMHIESLHFNKIT